MFLSFFQKNENLGNPELVGRSKCVLVKKYRKWMFFLGGFMVFFGIFNFFSQATKEVVVFSFYQTSLHQEHTSAKIRFKNFLLLKNTKKRATFYAKTAILPKIVPKTKNSANSENSFWEGHFSAENFQTPESKIDLEKIKEALREALLMLPKNHIDSLKNLEIQNYPNESRGLSNGKKIILHPPSTSDLAELRAVFIHEMGHIVDLGSMKGTEKFGTTEFWDGNTPVYADDKSLEFYRISWENAKNRKKTETRNNFVSGYAMTNCFEDFAESYVFYRLHGEKFRSLAQNSKKLKQKYEFLRETVFWGQEFGQEKAVFFENNLIWDATLVR